MHSDKEGKYICLNANAACDVNYHIISSQLFPFVNNFNVIERDDSDLLPVCSQISCICNKQI